MRASGRPRTVRVCVCAFRGSPRRGRLERRLPADIDEQVPESKLYTASVALEKKLDASILRRRLEHEDALRRQPRTKRILRIFLSNLAANQPHFAQNETDNSEYLPPQTYPQPPSWTLRIEGRLLDVGVRAPTHTAGGGPGSLAALDRHPMLTRDRPGRGAPPTQASKRAGTPPKFSSLVQSLVVEFERDPELQPGLDVVEVRPLVVRPPPPPLVPVTAPR